MTCPSVPRRPRVVVLRALGLGDLLTAVPALRGLARAFPEHHRVLAAPAWQGPLASLTGAVHDVEPALPLAALPAVLHDADVAVNLHGRGPRSTALLAATAPRRLLAFDVDGGPAWRDDEHDRRRWCRLLHHHGIAADPDDLLLPVPDVAIAAMARDATVIHPGAAAAARRWPAERWAGVARAEARAGRRVLITGSPDERDRAAEVADLAGLEPSAVLAGRTDAVALVGLVGVAGRVVCGDTGLAHVASATATPSVVLFGPMSPDRWGPPTHGPHIAIWHGRYGDPHGDGLDPGLAAITVDEVLDALRRLPQWASCRA
jgi:ADP-heptose:LPS heptosyltransferase